MVYGLLAVVLHTILYGKHLMKQYTNINISINHVLFLPVYKLNSQDSFTQKHPLCLQFVYMPTNFVLNTLEVLEFILLRLKLLYFLTYTLQTTISNIIALLFSLKSATYASHAMFAFLHKTCPWLAIAVTWYDWPVALYGSWRVHICLHQIQASHGTLCCVGCVLLDLSWF